jgi:hypothetical protein
MIMNSLSLILAPRNPTKMVKFGKGTTSGEKENLMDLIMEFNNTFYFSYEDIKGY